MNLENMLQVWYKLLTWQTVFYQEYMCRSVKILTESCHHLIQNNQECFLLKSALVNLNQIKSWLASTATITIWLSHVTTTFEWAAPLENLYCVVGVMWGGTEWTQSNMAAEAVLGIQLVSVDSEMNDNIFTLLFENTGHHSSGNMEAASTWGKSIWVCYMWRGGKVWRYCFSRLKAVSAVLQGNV